MPGLDYLSRALRDLGRVRSQIARDASDKIKEQIEADFAKGVDPYGKAWAPLKPRTLAKGRTPPPLTDTGKGLKGIIAKPLQGAGISVTSHVDYMDKHQTGTPDMAARPFIPYGVLPKTWRAAIKKAADEHVSKATGKNVK